MTTAIYVTLGRDQLREKGYREVIKTFLESDGEKLVYCWRLNNKPTRDFIDVYIVIGNKVRWKARSVGIVENKEFTFTDGRTMYSKVWIELIDFERMPRPYEIKKGFQGFRYK